MIALRQLRRERGLSVQELAKAADVSPMTIYRYEEGNRLPTVTVAYKIAVALGVKIDDLLRGEEKVG
ncbi:MAG: helix-turn-helix transcriptional regulator [Oscillospiraceae bacterium]|nr:helix-turn-helix transcriptional regulator [Oscillospiraceae bacterium]